MSDQRDGGISWTEQTWNPIRGCSRVSEGCRNCYAETMAARFSGPGQPYEGLAKSTPSGPRWTGKVMLVEDHLADPLKWTRPRLVFVNSMSDLFHEALTNEQIAAVFGVMAAAPRHTFQVLTKRAKRMREWFAWLEATARQIVNVFPDDPVAWRRAHLLSAAGLRTGALSKKPISAAVISAQPWPLPNVWLGVSVEDQASADERIPYLLETPAAVRWVSYEPALGPVDFGAWLGSRDYVATEGGQFASDPAIDWIVVGGESGPGARPFDVELARKTIEACRAAEVACFVKQLGARPYTLNPNCTAQDDEQFWSLRDKKGGDPSEWPEDLRVREWPKTSKESNAHV